MSIYLEGDPKLVMTQDGVDIVVRNGQPAMDRGFENAVMISLFTDENYWGNILARSDSEIIGSPHFKDATGPITLSKLAQIEQSINESLKWIQENNIGTVESIVTNPISDMIVEIIKIKQPDSESVFTASNIGGSWINQANDPAYKRI